MRREANDWLSPIVVKEIRQGVRGKSFVVSFLVLQGLMVTSVFLSLAIPVSGWERQAWDAAFWTMVAFPIVLSLPLSGIAALSGEVKAKTLELIFLTRLSGFRIVLGKWAAIVSLSLLCGTAVLPYVVLRYFLGGIDIWEDLQALGGLLAASAVLTGMTVGLSGFMPGLGRGGMD